MGKAVQAATLAALLGLAACAGPSSGADSSAPNAQPGAGGGTQESTTHPDNAKGGSPAR
jgi:ABC-type glycerol-3-phosphate transport system substrate-binding protein